MNAEDFWSLAESLGRRNIKAYILLEVDRTTMRVKSFDQTKLRHLAQFLYGKKRVVTDTPSAVDTEPHPRLLAGCEEARTEGANLDEASLYVASKQETIAQLVRQVEKLFAKIRVLSPGKDDGSPPQRD